MTRFRLTKTVRELARDQPAGHTPIQTALKWTAGALGLAVGGYATCVGATWLRYGQPRPSKTEEADLLLDRFMPVYEVAERHHIHVAAPADVTFAAACEQDLMAVPVVRTIFRAREIVLRSETDTLSHPRPHASVFRTETRLVTTDAAARAKFRWYWARFSPGILLIRWLMLRPL